jgi:hypothetical protein
VPYAVAMAAGMRRGVPRRLPFARNWRGDMP